MKKNPGNTAGGWKKKPRTHCLKGHELTADNTYLWKSKNRVIRQCRLCRDIRDRIWKENNPEKAKEIIRRHSRKKLYGITQEAYDALLAKQSGVCAICKQPPINEPLSVDHDHATNQIRGLLHRVCNTGIGNLKDDSMLCRLAAEYLEKFNYAQSNK